MLSNIFSGMIEREFDNLERDSKPKVRRRPITEATDDKEFKVDKEAFWETLISVMPETVTVRYISEPNKSNMGVTLVGFESKNEDDMFKLMGKEEDEKAEGITIDKTKVKSTYFKFDPHVKAMFDACVEMKDGDKFLFMDLGDESAWESLKSGETAETAAADKEPAAEPEVPAEPAAEPVAETPEAPAAETPAPEGEPEPVKESVEAIEEAKKKKKKPVKDPKDCDDMDDKTKSMKDDKKPKLKSLKESFMQPTVSQGKYWEVETTHGIFIVPAEVAGEDADKQSLSQYVEGDIMGEPEMKEGWYGRMSAPGYLDATDWIAGDSEDAVKQELADAHGEEKMEMEPESK